MKVFKKKRIARPIDAASSMIARWQSPWLLGTLLFAIVLITYSQVSWAGFIWDDDSHLTQNPCIVGPLGFFDIWTIEQARICPLVLSSFWLQHAIWGINPLLFHWTTVLMFAGNAVVLWRVLEALRIPGGWFAAMIWAVHPVQVESVAWITELKNTQSGLFYLLSILFFVRGYEQPSFSARAYGLSLLFGAMAMASKSSTVILPVILGFCVWWLDGQFRWRAAVKLIPFLVMAILATSASVLTNWNQCINDSLFERGLLERVAIAGHVIWFYLGKFFWPASLIFIYPRWSVHTSTLSTWISFLFVLMVLGISWSGRNGRFKSVWMAFSCFIVALLPVLGLVNHYFLRYSFVGDHFQYLASMAPAAFVAAMITKSADFIPRWPVFIRNCVFGFVVLSLAIRTWFYIPVFFDDTTLWRATLAVNPRAWIAHSNLGQILFDAGKVDEAYTCYMTSLSIHPENEKTHYNLGTLLSSRGDYEGAIEHFKLALEKQLNDSMIHSNIGATYWKAGRREEAIKAFQTAIFLDADNGIAVRNLGEAFFELGNLQDGVALLRSWIGSHPKDAEAYSNLANGLIEIGKHQEAIEQWRTCLAIDAKNDRAMSLLGNTLLNVGSVMEATSLCEQAISINPKNDKAYYVLGNAALQSGQTENAIQFFTQAISLNSGYAQAHNNLGAALAQKGQLDQAVEHWRAAWTLDPGYVGAAMNLGQTLIQHGDVPGAIAVFQKTLDHVPNAVPILDRLAWILSTHPSSDIRNGRVAHELAARAAQLTQHKDIAILRTLAAACAEAGRFPEAIATVEQADQLPSASDDKRTALAQDLIGFRNGLPVRDASLQTP